MEGKGQHRWPGMDGGKVDGQVAWCGWRESGWTAGFHLRRGAQGKLPPPPPPPPKQLNCTPPQMKFLDDTLDGWPGVGGGKVGGWVAWCG